MLKAAQQFRTQLACLGEASRYGLVRLLQARSRFVTELAGEMGLSQSCTTRHLQALKRCGLVCAERRGKRVMYRLCSEDPSAATLLDWALGDRTAAAPKPVESRPAIPKSPVGNRRLARVATGPAAHHRSPAGPRHEAPLPTPPAAREVPGPGPVPAPARLPVPAQAAGTNGPPIAHPSSPVEPAPAASSDSDVPPRRHRPGDLEDFLL